MIAEAWKKTNSARPRNSEENVHGLLTICENAVSTRGACIQERALSVYTELLKKQGALTPEHKSRIGEQLGTNTEKGEFEDDIREAEKLKRKLDAERT